MRYRPALLQLTALTALGAVVAVGGAIASQPPPATSRLGASIKENLGQRDRSAAEQKRQLDLQQQAIKAAQTRLQDQLGGAKPVSAPGAAPAKDSNLVQPQQPDEAIQNLARIYQAMKPAKAAAVLEKLNLDVQVKVAKEIRDRSMGQIMGAMSPEGAAKLSATLANNGKVPATIITPPPKVAPGTPSQEVSKGSVPANQATAKPSNRPAS
jgi:flagellar motility protein MotE (MotC chaperone)